MDYFALDGYYRLSRIGILPLAVVNFKRSVPQVVVITGMGALLAYLFSDLIATHVMGFESTAMLGGMMVVLQLCSSFPQFSGNQESYTARQNFLLAVTCLETAALMAKIGRFRDDLKAAIAARRSEAQKEMVAVKSISTGTIVSYKPFIYDRSFDRAILKLAQDNNPHAAEALKQLAQIDALCRAAAPATLIDPVYAMYLMLFACVMPLTLYPAMGWWYVLFSFPPTFVCIGGFNQLCEASEFFSPRIPEYVAAIDAITKELSS